MLTFMAKPTSFQCNIHCDYCFYLGKKAVVPPPPARAAAMSDEVLAAFIARMFSETVGDDVYFSWQGGEPTLAGLPFFQRVIDHQAHWRKRTQKKAHNALQSNGILIDDNWAAFLKQHDFLVGVSIDGDEELHDTYRVTRSGHGSWRRVMQGIETLQCHNVDVNLLATVNNINVRHPLRVYRFLKSLGSRHLQFTPIVENDAGSGRQLPRWLRDEAILAVNSHFSVDAEQYGAFICAIFDDWLRHDIGAIHVQIFEALLARFCGFSSPMCIWQPRCGGENLALEHNGDVYQCDHLVYRDSKIGNIAALSLPEIAARASWLSDKKERLNRQCAACDWQPLCHGGCPKHRFVVNNEGELHNYFCAGYQAIFRHLTPAMNFMAELRASGLPATTIRDYLPQIGY